MASRVACERQRTSSTVDLIAGTPAGSPIDSDERRGACPDPGRGLLSIARRLATSSLIANKL
jgi:hypothetical protein